MILLRALVAIGLALGTTLAAALDDKYYVGDVYMFERSERYESIFGGAVTYLRSSGHDEFEPVSDALLIEGVLSQETLVHVKRLLPKEPGFTVFLDSPGGDLLAGLALGRLFHERQSKAVSNRNAQCKSACALAFLGAQTRLISGEASALGFHRQYRLINQQITYGDIEADRKLIAAYLALISFAGLSAVEITSTTRDATFSETSLRERGLITATRAELEARYRTMLAYTGMTPFEAVSRICAKYDHRVIDPQYASLEVISILMTCARRVPSVREPLLLTTANLPATSLDEDLELVEQDSVAKVLRSADPAAIRAFNQTFGKRDGTYERWLERRKLIRERLSVSHGTD